MSQVRTRVLAAFAVGVLGVACVGWAAVPLAAAGGARRVLMVAGLAAVAFESLRLATAAPVAGDTLPDSGVSWLGGRARRLAHVLPWSEVALVSALLLEVFHPARPWHTALLGAALLCYVFGTHAAESGTG
ncbi:MAG TPA: hypothetical protein VIV12_12640, partial [Streptosporangiaceae bacterium]